MPLDISVVAAGVAATIDRAATRGGHLAVNNLAAATGERFGGGAQDADSVLDLFCNGEAGADGVAGFGCHFGGPFH